ncbi:dihydrolipoyl dehydrogenase [Pontiella agarivorans]|uniref:Dihydrolipoyl dehydrogenase n=1 Tax=Pontiella agarivorans TaxID=3038953 RepID=A0ABU5MWI1_9BACT|nr:dihydrolipoyl dehydrogenase [Pontiella agarivorans]MDZ8118530.1 dihydrolipoyl dehydrogenase [Pontiella agarivorans]
MESFDIIIIGSGGGTKIARPAADLGFKVAMIEKEAMGGTCLNRGCIPSKMVIHPADQIHHIKHSPKINIDADLNPQIRFKEMIERVTGTVDNISEGLAPPYEAHPDIELIFGEATFSGNHSISVNGRELSAERIFIAVGTRPQIPNIPGLEGTPYMTNREALRNTELPPRMIVIGAGYIGCELGHAYSSAGTDVHFIVRSELIRREDREIKAEFKKVFSENNTLHEGYDVEQVEYDGSVFSVQIRNKDGAFQTLEAEALLVATGIVPNTDFLGLENTDIQLDDHGFIPVDGQLQSSVPGVYAMGDCNGNYFFRHTVNWEGEFLMRVLFEDPSDETIDYGAVPHAVFTYPQVAGVGKTEDELIADGADYVRGFCRYENTAMGMARQADHGFVKILIGRKDKTILGAHIIGDEASNMLHMIVALMYKNGTLDDLLNMIYIHPALPEAVRDAARDARDQLKIA